MREIRRRDREIEPAEAARLLSEGEYGVLSTVDEDGQPYGVPLSYVYRDNCIYFHCALVGHKLDNIEGNPKVSFCVVGDTHVIPSKFATAYESAVAFGVAAEVEGAERLDALEWLVDKYSPGYTEEGKVFIQEHGQSVRIIRMRVTHISGKRARPQE
jgi:nitroimidazol reductase NimA-like FMN-containing flavoprotein (pyridoxamine 5'-phosphate oxidase superfamily)